MLTNFSTESLYEKYAYKGDTERDRESGTREVYTQDELFTKVCQC